MQKQIPVIAALLAILPGCGSNQDEIAESAPASALAGLPAPTLAPDGNLAFLLRNSPALHDLSAGEKTYLHTCSICHKLGLRGAPRLGDSEDWALRLAQGNETLYSHAINGYRGSKGSMPSRGSNARLSENEVKAAVDYMLWHSAQKSQDTLGSHLFSAVPKQFTIRQ